MTFKEIGMDIPKQVQREIDTLVQYYIAPWYSLEEQIVQDLKSKSGRVVRFTGISVLSGLNFQYSIVDSNFKVICRPREGHIHIYGYEPVQVSSDFMEYFTSKIEVMGIEGVETVEIDTDKLSKIKEIDFYLEIDYWKNEFSLACDRVDDLFDDTITKYMPDYINKRCVEENIFLSNFFEYFFSDVMDRVESQYGFSTPK